MPHLARLTSPRDGWYLLVEFQRYHAFQILLQKGADFGKLPYCGYNTVKRGLMCYNRCRSGYSYKALLCYKRCPSGYKDHGLSCYKSLFRWHSKESYGPKDYTNFHYKAVCRSSYYKSGALCYRDCRNIGLQNCGIGACSLTRADCGASIATMAFDVIVSSLQARSLCSHLRNELSSESTHKSGEEVQQNCSQSIVPRSQELFLEDE